MKKFRIDAAKKFLALLCLPLLAFIIVGVGVNKVEAYVFTQNMRMGSVGGEVMELQRTLNETGCKVAAAGAGSAGLETMYFGVLTDAAARCFQASRALVADGIVGPMTRAALNGLVVVVPPPSNLPPGCLPGYAFSATTGQSCLNPTLPPGCAPGYLFSTTTGQPCSGSTGGLQGSSGSIENAVFISSLSNEEVGESDNDVKVAGLRVEADNGSDIELTSVRLNLSEGTAGEDFDEYAEEVSIWFDGREVANLDASDFTSGDDFDETITLNSGAIIRAGQTKNLEVVVSGQSNISSSNLGDTWTIEFESIRFRDAQNVVTTDTSTGDIGGATRTFSFEEESSGSNDDNTSGATELEIAETNNNPDERNVLADDTDDTENVLLLAGELRNNSDSEDVELQELVVRILPGGSGDASEIASSFTLIIDGDEVQTINSNDCEEAGDCDGSGESTAVEYIFDDIDITLDADSDTSFEIRADINSISGEVSEGDSLTASMDADDIIAEDEANDELGTGELEGMISGNEQSFYTVLP